MAVVTGASRGIGRHLVEALAARGATVAMCARSGPALVELEDHLRRSYDTSIRSAVVDVRDAAAIARFASEVVDDVGPPHLLVNNAGVLGPIGPIDAVDLREWGAALDVNVLGTVHATSAFLPAMVVRGSGCVVNLAGGGVGGADSPARMSAYVASKGAIVALTEVLARELHGTGVRVNAVSPGAVNSGLMEAAIEAGPDRAGWDLYDRSVRIRNLDDTATLARLVDLVVFLASDEAAPISGRLLAASRDALDDLRRLGEDAGSTFRLRRIDGIAFGALDGGAPGPDG